MAEQSSTATLETPRASAVVPPARAARSLEDQVEVGMGHCRRREWHSALNVLAPLATMPIEKHRSIPANAWSCLGLALVRERERRHEGMSLCRDALRVDPHDPDNYLNLASGLLFVRLRREAATILLQGRKLAPSHAGLRELHVRMGIRQPPVIAFLSRGNILNRWLGARRFARNCNRADRHAG